MKKNISVLMSILLFLSMISWATADELTKVSVDGQILNFDVPPTIVDGRTLVPLRAIFNSLGVEVEWNAETRTVTANKDTTKVILTVDNKFAFVNNQQIELDVPATIIEGRIMIPARFIAESLNSIVDWNENTKTVMISSSITETFDVDLPKELTVHFIDVGQGDATFIDYGDYDILIDGGSPSNGKLVVDYLKSLDTDDIEIMVATHPDYQHVGGLGDVLEAFKVETIIESWNSREDNRPIGGFFAHDVKRTYYEIVDYGKITQRTVEVEDKEEIEILAERDKYVSYPDEVKKEEGAKFIIADTDMKFNLGNGVEFEVIETGDNLKNPTMKNDSVVTKLTYNDVEFLFTGGIEKDAEKNILDKDIQADILKVANNGSDCSTSSDFLDKVKPQVAVISAGKYKRYKEAYSKTLPVLNRYVDKVYGTCLSGNIIVTTDGKTFSINATDEL